MKRLNFIFCVLLLLGGLLFLPVRAAEPEYAAVRFYDENAMTYLEETPVRVVNVSLNGAPLEMDVPALTYSVDGMDSRTLVPVRPIAEALGADVLWTEESRQVILSAHGDTVALKLGSAAAMVNGESVHLPGAVPAQIVRCGGAERTMVPLRFIAERLHAQVGWDGDAYAALIVAPSAKDGEPMPLSGAVPDQETVLPGLSDIREDNRAAGQILRIVYDNLAETVILYLNADPRYAVTDLGDRVVIDLPGFAIKGGEDGSMRVESPVIADVRYARHTGDISSDEGLVTRVVLDLTPGCSYGKDITVVGDPNLQAIVVKAHLSGELAGEVSVPRLGEIAPSQAAARDWDPAAFVVCLDAGHGGKASGAEYENYREKDITLPITLRAARLLREKGYNVVLTRSEDVYINLYDRCDIANEAGCDIFVSIHANASSTNPSFQGTFTYHYPDSAEGEKLARAVQAAVVAETGSINRGLLTNNYVVLRETRMPACLLETGFMSAHDELTRLVAPDYQEKLARGVVGGVESYLSSLAAHGEIDPE